MKPEIEIEEVLHQMGRDWPSRSLADRVLQKLDSVPVQPAKFVGRKIALATVGLSTCLVLSFIVWTLFSAVTSRPAYALDGLHERFLRSRSLHLKFSFYQRYTADGKEVETSIPVEWYAERPSRYFIRGCTMEDNGNGMSIKTHLRGSDGECGFFVSDSDKTVVRTKLDRLSTELNVEYLLQNQFVQQIINGPTGDYRLIGTEQILGRKVIKYERLKERKDSHTRNVIWINAATGLPVRAAVYEIDSNERERPLVVYDTIDVNGPPPAGVFPLAAPEGYQLVDGGVEPADFVCSSGGAGKDRSAERYVLAIDRLAVLVCWYHGIDGQEIKHPDEDPVIPEAILHRDWGSSDKQSPDRKCELHLIRTQSEQGKLWRWSLALPVDRRPIELDEVFSFILKYPSGSSSSSGNYPLHLDDKRLKDTIAQMQGLGTPVGDIEPEIQLVRLRWLAARYLTDEFNNELKDNDKK